MKCELCGEITISQVPLRDDGHPTCFHCRMSDLKYISDYTHNKVLGGHSKCCALNGFTHFEYYNKRDVADFIKDVLLFIPDQKISTGIDEDGKERFSTTHIKIKELAGKELVR